MLNYNRSILNLIASLLNINSIIENQSLLQIFKTRQLAERMFRNKMTTMVDTQPMIDLH